MIKKIYHHTKKHIRIFSSKKNRNKTLAILAVIVAIFAATIYLSKYVLYFLNNPDQVRDFVASFGVLGPLVLILMQILQVLVAPVPGQVAGFVSGYIYGIFFGTIYTMIGTMLGSFIAITLARKFGRPFVEKVVERHTLKKFDKIAQNKGIFALFLIWLLPALPDDAVCYISGLTKIRIRTLMIIIFLGRLPGFIVLNMVGNGVAIANATFSFVIFGVLMVLSFIIFKTRHNLEATMTNLVSKIKDRKKGNFK